MNGPAPSCQVVKLLGSNVQLVHKELLALLQDDALEVRDHTHCQHCSTIQGALQCKRLKFFLWFSVILSFWFVFCCDIGRNDSFSLVSHAEAFVVVEVLDALMNHLEETLEAVLNRGQNLMLDNKVGNKPPPPNLSVLQFL